MFQDLFLYVGLPGAFSALTVLKPEYHDVAAGTWVVFAVMKLLPEGVVYCAFGLCIASYHGSVAYRQWIAKRKVGRCEGLG